MAAFQRQLLLMLCLLLRTTLNRSFPIPSSSSLSATRLLMSSAAFVVIDRRFASFSIPAASIFYATQSSFSFVNLRPIVPGHVLVCPNRIVPLLSDLKDEEYDDLWKTVRATQAILKRHYDCDAFNVAVQDGRSAGQSVPHVHVHILPRTSGDLERNDDIYDALQEWAPRDELRVPQSLEVPDDDQRRDRTRQEMAEEAASYREIAKIVT